MTKWISLVSAVIERFGLTPDSVVHFKERGRNHLREAIRPSDWGFLIVVGTAALFISLEIVYLFFLVARDFFSIAGTLIQDFPTSLTINDLLQYTKNELTKVFKVISNTMSFSLIDSILWLSGILLVLIAIALWGKRILKNLFSFRTSSTKNTNWTSWLLLFAGLAVHIAAFTYYRVGGGG
ncbi:hypothetical protein [Effusibacillus pohliae]|uniref:hypothetical protein n=1 Tax=Effusibacillus pohliae TaxID=232270 RepID=UPI00035CAE37|nr:hypothetical protein [Effusibacillus pohliae]